MAPSYGSGLDGVNPYLDCRGRSPKPESNPSGLPNPLKINVHDVSLCMRKRALTPTHSAKMPTGNPYMRVKIFLS